MGVMVTTMPLTMFQNYLLAHKSVATGGMMTPGRLTQPVRGRRSCAALDSHPERIDFRRIHLGDI